MGNDLSYGGYQKYNALADKHKYLAPTAHASNTAFLNYTLGGFLGTSLVKSISRSGHEKSMPLLRSFWANAVAEEEARQATKWIRRQKLYETSGSAHGEEVSDVSNNNERGNLY